MRLQSARPFMVTRWYDAPKPCANDAGRRGSAPPRATRTPFVSPRGAPRTTKIAACCDSCEDGMAASLFQQRSILAEVMYHVGVCSGLKRGIRLSASAHAVHHRAPSCTVSKEICHISGNMHMQEVQKSSAVDPYTAQVCCRFGSSAVAPMPPLAALFVSM